MVWFNYRGILYWFYSFFRIEFWQKLLGWSLHQYFYYIHCILPETIEILIILIFSDDLLFFNVRDESIFISKIIKLNSIFSFKLLMFCHLKIEIWVFYIDLFWSWTIFLQITLQIMLYSYFVLFSLSFLARLFTLLFKLIQ